MAKRDKWYEFRDVSVEEARGVLVDMEDLANSQEECAADCDAQGDSKGAAGCLDRADALRLAAAKLRDEYLKPDGDA